MCQPEDMCLEESTRSPANCPEEEVEQKRITLLTQVVDEECRILRQSDNLPKVLRLTAYLLRIDDQLRKKTIEYWTSPPTIYRGDRQSFCFWTVLSAVFCCAFFFRQSVTDSNNRYFTVKSPSINRQVTIKTTVTGSVNVRLFFLNHYSKLYFVLFIIFVNPNESPILASPCVGILFLYP